MNSNAFKTFQICQLLCCSMDNFNFESRCNSATWNILRCATKIGVQFKKNRKNGSNWHLKKHNHDKRSTCFSLKMPCLGISLRNPDFDIGQKVVKIKNKLSSYRWPLLFRFILFFQNPPHLVLLCRCKKILYGTVFCFKFQSYYKIKNYLYRYRTDGIKNYHLFHSASLIPNPAHCPTMISSFQLSSGTVCLPRFCRFYLYSNVSGRSPQIIDFSLYSVYNRSATKPSLIDCTSVVPKLFELGAGCRLFGPSRAKAREKKSSLGFDL